MTGTGVIAQYNLSLVPAPGLSWLDLDSSVCSSAMGAGDVEGTARNPENCRMAASSRVLSALRHGSNASGSNDREAHSLVLTAGERDCGLRCAGWSVVGEPWDLLFATLPYAPGSDRQLCRDGSRIPEAFTPYGDTSISPLITGVPFLATPRHPCLVRRREPRHENSGLDCGVRLRGVH